MTYLDFIEKYAGVFIALFALLWTIGTFWWMNWHKGKIEVSTPRTYAAISHPTENFLLIRLPLVFYNTGAATIIVQNLRLTLKQEDIKSPILYFNHIASEIDTPTQVTWARQFPVEGRKAVSIICEFLRKPKNNYNFHAGNCTAIIEGKFDNDANWKIVCKFIIPISENNLRTLNSNQIIAYDNDPDRE
jgi:hypothetical protein